jgi:hypothetical protein
MKKLIAAMIIGTATFAAAETTFLMVTGMGSSESQSEAIENAMSQATDNLNAQCDGRLRNIQHSMTYSKTGTWYYVTATMSAWCDK